MEDHVLGQSHGTGPAFMGLAGFRRAARMACRPVVAWPAGHETDELSNLLDCMTRPLFRISEPVQIRDRSLSVWRTGSPPMEAQETTRVVHLPESIIVPSMSDDVSTDRIDFREYPCRYPTGSGEIEYLPNYLKSWWAQHRLDLQSHLREWPDLGYLLKYFCQLKIAHGLKWGTSPRSC